MQFTTRLVAGFAAMAVAALGFVSTAAASGQEHADHADHAVFVQTNELAGNQIAAYARSDDGSLSPAGTYRTGGLGGALGGAPSDKLASQGSLVFDARHDALIAVNAGSNSLSVFRVKGDELKLRQVVTSNGTFPVSVAVHDDLVYVLNARDGGSVAGYTFKGGRLRPISNSVRQLGLDPTAIPEFLNTPAQVGFSPDGRHLIVTTKGNGHDIVVYDVGHNGRLSQQPVVNPQPVGTAPFAFVFAQDRLVLTQAGTSSLAKYDLADDGTLPNLATVPNGQIASCWISAANGYFYVSNTGSSNISIYHDDGPAGLTLINAAVPTDPGTIDSTVSDDEFLYVQSGLTGIVDAFHIGSDGSLTPIGTTLVPNAIGFEGIAAT